MGTQSYSPSSNADLHRVRRLIRDTDTPDNAALDDEEIESILADEDNVYLAAAACAELVLADEGAVAKLKIGDLQIDGANSQSSYRAHVRALRERGIEMQFADADEPRVISAL